MGGGPGMAYTWAGLLDTTQQKWTSKANQEGHTEQPRVSVVYLKQSQQQQVPVVDFQVELRQAFLAETPRGG